MSKYGVEFEGVNVIGYVDSDQDGKKSLKLEINLAAIMSEFSKGEKVSKAIVFEMDGMTLVGKIDPNQDGVAVGKVELDIAEAGDEVLGLLKK